MEKITWNVYNKFHCIADKCPDSCCAGWEVDIDPDTAAFYRKLPGQLGDRLRQVLKSQDGDTAMVLENGRCPMWQQDGLCRIHAQLGHDALCQVCREYPRLHLDYGDFTEWGLELSCPEAARLIFADQSVHTEPLTTPSTPEYDPELMAILQKSREEILRFWQETTLSPQEALTITLYYAHLVQGALDGGDFPAFSPEACLQAGKRYAGNGSLTPLLAFFAKLEILTETWRYRLQHPLPGAWDHQLRTLAIYLIRRYWLQAVWDFDLVCRAKFVVSACILVNALGGDIVQTSQLFSKEIENDPDNLDAILDAAYSQETFTDANLFGLLLQN